MVNVCNRSASTISYFFRTAPLNPIARFSSKIANPISLFLFHPNKAFQKLAIKQQRSIVLSRKNLHNPINLSLLYREASASNFVEKFCPENTLIPSNQKVITQWNKLKKTNKYDKMVELYNSSKGSEFTKERLPDYLDAFLRSSYIHPKFALDLSEIILKKADKNSNDINLNCAIALDAQAKIAKRIAQMNKSECYDVNFMKMYKSCFENSSFENADTNYKKTSELAYQQFEIAYQNKKTDLGCLYLIFASLEIGKIDKAIKLANDMWLTLGTKSIDSEQKIITSIVLSVIISKKPQELTTHLQKSTNKSFFNEVNLKTFKRTITQIFKNQGSVSYKKQWKEIRDHLNKDLFGQ